MLMNMDAWKIQMLYRIVENAQARCANEYECKDCRMYESCNYLILKKELEKYVEKIK